MGFPRRNDTFFLMLRRAEAWRCSFIIGLYTPWQSGRHPSYGIAHFFVHEGVLIHQRIRWYGNRRPSSCMARAQSLFVLHLAKEDTGFHKLWVPMKSREADCARTRLGA